MTFRDRLKGALWMRCDPYYTFACLAVRECPALVPLRDVYQQGLRFRLGLSTAVRIASEAKERR